MLDPYELEAGAPPAVPLLGTIEDVALAMDARVGGGRTQGGLRGRQWLCGGTKQNAPKSSDDLRRVVKTFLEIN